MKSIVTFALSLALTTALAVPAFAGEHTKDAFPMKADVFQQKVEMRLERGKARMEKRITEKNVDEARAKAMRERFEARATKVRAAVAAAAQDGVITQDEAKAIHGACGRHHGRHAKKS
jgi:hypothetical protein